MEESKTKRLVSDAKLNVVHVRGLHTFITPVRIRQETIICRIVAYFILVSSIFPGIMTVHCP